jgi:hypothetical protein
MGTLLFVHGTGVRKESYDASFEVIAHRVARHLKLFTLRRCEWYTAMPGVADLLSVPAYGATARSGLDGAEQEAYQLWDSLDLDPLWELRILGSKADILNGADMLPPGSISRSLLLLRKVKQTGATPPLNAMLNEYMLASSWPEAFNSVISENAVTERAATAAQQDVEEFAQALARAVIARLMIVADDNAVPAISGDIRDRLVDCLLSEWQMVTRGPLQWLGGLLLTAALGSGTSAVKRRRARLSEFATPVVGDILAYQVRGEAVRLYILNEISKCVPPVALLCHSLGGIAAVDLLAAIDLSPVVTHLITIGSQAGLFYELNALKAAAKGHSLPPHFPRAWLNLYDRNDFLSYTAAPIFPQNARDFEIRTNQPFPRSHGAYWHTDAAWDAITAFLGKIP